MTKESPPSDNEGHSSRSRSSRSNGTKAGIIIKPPKLMKDLNLKDHTKIIQVANVAPQATKEEMQALFSYIGKIDDLRLYPSSDLGIAVTSKICFVKFYESSSVGTAQHLTNTVFIDRALIVIPFTEGVEIPDELKSLELLTSDSLLPGIADPKLPQHVTSQMDPQGVVTIDPKLEENGLPPYPKLPSTCDNRKIEEIRRTVLVANIDPNLGAQDIVDVFSTAGEIKYFRFCTRDNDPIHYALMEFTEQPAILEALKKNGQKIGSKFIKVYHAGQAIQKPQAKTNEAAQKEIEEAMARQAQSIMNQGLESSALDTGAKRLTGGVKDKTSGPRIIRSRTRSRSRSPIRIMRRRYSRSRSRSRSRRRSRDRRRSRSSSRKRSSQKSKSSSKKSRSKSRERKRRSRSRSKGKRKSRSGSRSRSKRSKKGDEKDKDKDKDKDRDKEKKKSKRDRNDDDKAKDRDKDRDKSEKDKKEKDHEKKANLEVEKEKEKENGSDMEW